MQILKWAVIVLLSLIVMTLARVAGLNQEADTVFLLHGFPVTSAIDRLIDDVMILADAVGAARVHA